MKKLEISQMENLQGEGKNRDCAIKGFLTGVAIIAGAMTAGAAWYWGGLAGAAGGGLSSVECF